MSSSRSNHHRQRLVGLARGGLLLLAAMLLLLVLSVRASVARADESMMQLGRHLLVLSEAGLGHDRRGVLLNGQSLGFRVFTTEQDMDTALDFYESWCREGFGNWAEQEQSLQNLAETQSPQPGKGDRSWRDLTQRTQQQGMGYVACVKHGIASISAREIGQRLMAFMESGNLQELGQFHYAAVTSVGDATRVVAVWTEGAFYPARLFPSEGDAPGFHPDGISPPPSGRRMLSAGELGNEETLGVYIDCEESLQELAAFYRRDFLQQGWRVMADQVDEGSRLFIVQRGHAMRVVSLTGDLGATSVTIATTR
jgi:hypothetical protein